MNRQTNLFSFEDNLINCIQNCLSNIPSFSTLAKHLSIDEIKKNIKKEQLQSEEKQRIIKKNTFQMIVNSIISVLGNDRFKIEKAIFPQNCPFCQYGVHNSFDINYVAINLSNYLGEKFEDINEKYNTKVDNSLIDESIDMGLKKEKVYYWAKKEIKFSQRKPKN